MARIPSLYPQAGTSFELKTVTLRRTSLIKSLKKLFQKRSGISPDEAFARVLRILLATRTEFAFLLGKNTRVQVEALDEDSDAETLSYSDVGLDHGLQAQLLLGADAPTPTDRTLFCIHLTSQSIHLQYSPSHIPEPFAKDLLRLFASFVSGGSSETFRQLSILNHTPSVLPDSQPALLHARFLQQAQLHPDHTAIEYLQDDHGRQTLSYAELDTRSNIVASLLRKSLSSGEHIVPFLLHPSLELYTAYIAILRAGYAFCPLPSLDSAPVSRLQELIADVSAKVVVGARSRPEWLDSSVKWLDINIVDSLTDPTSGTSIVNKDINPDSLAYGMHLSLSARFPYSLFCSPVYFRVDR